MKHYEEIEPLSICQLDNELIVRQSQGDVAEFFQFPHQLKKNHEGIEIMKRVKEIYFQASSKVPDPRLSRWSTLDLMKILRRKTRDLNLKKGVRFHDHRMDYKYIGDNHVKKNASAVVAILTEDQLEKYDENSFKISAYKFGKIFNLCACESFYHQPIALGRVSTGFLVRQDVIATAAHCINHTNLENYCFIFGYRIKEDKDDPLIIPKENVYKGIQVEKEYCKKANGIDWALIRLNRKVKDAKPLKIFANEIKSAQPVYILGYPLGLPMKYAPGAFVREIYPNYFISDLDVFSGNSGSPVIDLETHLVIGFVQKGDLRDFRRFGTCWTTVIYPKYEIYSKGAHCIPVFPLIENLKKI